MNKGVIAVILIAVILGAIAMANLYEWQNPGTFDIKATEFPQSDD